MHVLILDDPVLAANFISLEQPLLYSLHYYYRTELTAAQARVVDVAYESWGKLQQMLPLRFRTPGSDADISEEDGYVLENAAGQLLNPLHVIDAGQCVDHLRACYLMLRQAQLDGLRDPLADVLRQISDGNDDIGLTDCFRRVLQVLYLPSPPHLLAAVRRVEPNGSTALSLNGEQEREYRVFLETVVGILSGDDLFAHATHRALYAV